MTDELIVEYVLKGNTSIFSELVDRYKDQIYNMVYEFTYNASDAQDLSQEVFIKVYRNLHAFNRESSFSTWLYRVSYNLCIDWLRKNRKRLREISMEDVLISGKGVNYDIEENYIKRQIRATVKSAVNSMSEKYRIVIILYHYQGLSYEEISQILNISVRAVETRLYRARGLLKKKLCSLSYGGEYYEMRADT